MFRRKSNYEADTDKNTNSADDLSRQLAVDLRKHVRKIEMNEPFSMPWNVMIESLMHVANIAMMEHRLPRESGDEDSTLWEGDELTVRFLLEEGKLNPCLRLMIEYKAAKERATQRLYEESAKECSLSDADAMRQRGVLFEQSLGVLLRCALLHVEAVQTTDLPLLMEHCSKILSAATALGARPFAFDKCQEQLVAFYLSAVAERMDAQQAGLDESRVVPLIQQYNLVPLVVSLLASYSEQLKKDGRLAAASFLAYVLDSEAYGMPSQKASLTPHETLLKMKGFKATLDEQTADLSIRKKLRPLLDVIAKV